MPNTQKRSEPPTEEEKARIVTGPDPDRFYCPHPGCNRSFAELWRLKVHFRAPPDVRGSGKERGHGTELQFCPKCGKDLRPGKHHVGCSAGKSAPRQAAKRQRQQQMSTTTESAGLTTGTTEQTTTGSWELTARRPAVKQQRPGTEAESAQRAKRPATDASTGGRIEGLDAAAHAGQGEQQQLLYAMPGSAAAAVAAAGASGCDAAMHRMASGQHYGGHHFQAAGSAGGMMQHAGAAHEQQHAQQQQQHAQPAQPAQLPHLDLPQHPGGEHRPHSPSPLDLFGDPFAGGTNGHGGGGFGGGGGGGHGGGDHHTGGGLFGDDDDDDMLRIPSPPPLPADWETNAARPGMLFDFDQFDANKRQQQTGGASAPLVTVTTAMNPVDVFNPSDDYIWQILFAGENDAVPKRVTAHLHHPPATALSYLDDTDPLLDAILADDLPPAPGHAMTEAAAHREQHASGGSGGSGGTVPVAPGDGGGTSGSHHLHHMHHHHHGGMMLPSLDAVFGQQQVVPQQEPHQRHQPAAHPHQLMQQQQQQQAMGVPQPYRNGYGSHHGGAMDGVPPPAMKLEGAAATAAGGFI